MSRWRHDRAGRCGRCSSGPGAGCRTPTSAACTRPTPTMALRNARDVYTRRQEGVSIWVVPAAAITASSPDEKDAFFDPAADKIYRHPTFYEVPEGVAAPVNRDRRRRTLLRLGDDALIAAQRLGRVVRPRAGDGGGRRAGQHRARPARRGPAAADVRRRARGRWAATRTRWPTCATTREFRNCLLVELPNGPDFARRRDRRKLLFLVGVPAAALRVRCAGSPTSGSPRSPPRRARSRRTTSTTRHCGRSGSATAPTESHRRMQAAVDDAVAVHP